MVSCSIVNNRYTGEVGRARKQHREMLENSGQKTPFDGLHVSRAFTIHNKRNSTSQKIFRSAKSRKADYSFIFRREEKFLVKGDERFTRQSCSNIRNEEMPRSIAAGVVEVFQFFYIVQHARKVIPSFNKKHCCYNKYSEKSIE